MKRDGLTLGWGMAACSWQAMRFACAATVELRNDGTARVSCATQDIGTGPYTILAQLAADELALPLDKVEAVLGDSQLPPGPLSGGSAATAAVVPAVIQAGGKAIERPLALAPEEKLEYTRCRAHRAGAPARSGIAFDDFLR